MTNIMATTKPDVILIKPESEKMDDAALSLHVTS